MRKWMVEFLREIENRGIKIARVNFIRITKCSNLLYFYMVSGSVVIDGDYPAQYIDISKVYGTVYRYIESLWHSISIRTVL